MDQETIIEIVWWADLAVLTGAGLLLLPRYRHLKPALKYLSLYLWMLIIIEIPAKLYIYVWEDHDNLYLLYIYTALEFLLLSLMYSKMLSLNARRSKNLKRYITFMTLLIVTYSAHELLLKKWLEPEHFQMYSKLIVNGSMIVYSIVFIERVLRSPSSFINDYRAYMQINSGVLLYFAGSFIIFLTLNYLVFEDISQTIFFWLINAILTFIFHIMCIIALWQEDSRQTKV